MSAVPAAKTVLAAGLSSRSPAFISPLLAVALTAILLGCIAVGLGYVALVRPARLVQKTRYLITDRRVLIQRGNEELCLDRGRSSMSSTAPDSTACTTSSWCSTARAPAASPLAALSANAT